MINVLPPPPSEREHAIVLVHGAWVGEWSWAPVEPLLRASGRPVHAASLKGHGARRHESGPDITLGDHVADVVGLIEARDLTDVTLVGHSYGGLVVTRVWTEIPDRIVRLVYVDAHAPLQGYPGQPAERVAAAAARGGMLPLVDFVPDAELLGSDAGVTWFMDRAVAQSFATFAEPVDVGLPAELPKTYIHATGSESNRFEQYAELCRSDPDWDYHELEGSHWLMMSHPDEVAAIILAT